MPDELKLHKPWLVAVWPGMGHVAVSAGYYLLAKLGMHLLAEFSPHGLFEVEHVEVKDGLIHMGRLPRSRLFVWQDPSQQHDIVVFLGEAQPAMGKYVFCQRLIEFAKQLGVERVFTFAAMATDMRPKQPSRVFAAATDQEILEEMKRLELHVLEGGTIGGLNGVLLGVAAEASLRGACLLGEMPHIFANLPFPKAALAVLETFALIAGIAIDFTELAEQAKATEEKLDALLAQVETAMERQATSEAELAEPQEPEFSPEAADEGGLTADDKQHIEELFERAVRDRAKAYELKSELDRLGVFRDYENRFLDLFRKQE